MVIMVIFRMVVNWIKPYQVLLKLVFLDIVKLIRKEGGHMGTPITSQAVLRFFAIPGVVKGIAPGEACRIWDPGTGDYVTIGRRVDGTRYEVFGSDDQLRDSKLS